MYPFVRTSTVIATALAVCLAVASTAQAGGYAGNACVGKKQAAIGKYTKAVAKAWVKYPADATARDASIASAKDKLDGTWTKEEAKAAKKKASCNESTSTSTAAATAVNDAITAVSLDNFQAVADYIGSAMKAWSKYLKDPLKDPGKAVLEAALDAANTEYLAPAPTVATAATELAEDIVALTTTAPDYPDTFQTITKDTPWWVQGKVDPANVADKTNVYNKKVLSPTCVDGDPYMFFAKRGTTNKVLMYYQGGGACWDADSCFNIPPSGAPISSICSRTAEAGDNPGLSSTGFANYDDPANPFYEWNVVFVTYCTCDVHWGEQIKDYTEGPGGVARHNGRINAALVEKFAREHFVDPEKVFVTGSSAGSYGAIMNSYWLMKEVWPNAEYSVLGDAGVGVITQQFLNDKIVNWNVDANFPTDLPGVIPPVTNLSLVDLVDGLAQKFPTARFGNYDSSYDGGGGSQTQFYQAMRHPSTDGGSIIEDWSSFWLVSCEWNACMREFKAENSTRAAMPERTNNYHYFTGAGSRHTIFGSDKVYTETKSTKLDGTGVTFAQWVSAMIDDTGDWVDVDCNHPGGDCNLTNSCQGGTNAGGFCSQKCSGGSNDTLDCVNNTGCPGGTCVSSNADCPGGSCQLDQDSANAPYNNDDTVTCAPTTCPCGETAATCRDGANEGLPCTAATEAEDCPNGSCSWVRCPTFIP